MEMLQRDVWEMMLADVCRSVQSRLLHLGDNFSRFPLLFHNFTFYKLPNLLNRFKGRVIILLI